MSNESFRFTPAAPADVSDENALLRASLAEAQRRIEALEQAAEIDPLTRLPTESRFLRGLERVVAQAERHGTPAAMLHIDVRGLGAINEHHGSLAGDSALKHVAERVSGLIRATDHLANLGGGRFALLLDHLDQDSAIDAAERIARCIAGDPLDLGGSRLSIEVAVAATGILRGDTVDEVLRRADQNLARAKAGN
ncbi:MAG TPA: GGDEF domain-containing protein [Allosphingosinicella sp.]|jgi:diguanylate cyclase (GGDEF)-like protein